MHLFELFDRKTKSIYRGSTDFFSEEQDFWNQMFSGLLSFLHLPMRTFANEPVHPAKSRQHTPIRGIAVFFMVKLIKSQSFSRILTGG